MGMVDGKSPAVPKPLMTTPRVALMHQTEKLVRRVNAIRHAEVAAAGHDGVVWGKHPISFSQPDR